MVSVKVLEDCAIVPTIALPAWVHFTQKVSQAGSQFSPVWPWLHRRLMLCVLRFRSTLELQAGHLSSGPSGA